MLWKSWLNYFSAACCPFVTADFPGSHYFGVPLSAVHISPAPLVLCGAALPVVVSEDVTVDTQAIRFFHAFLSVLSLLNCSFLYLLRGALKEVRKFIMVIFNGFLKSSTTQIELIQENLLELQHFLLLKIFLSLQFFCKKIHLFFPSSPITKPCFLMFPHGQILAISLDNLVWSCVWLAFLL